MLQSTEGQPAGIDLTGGITEEQQPLLSNSMALEAVIQTLGNVFGPDNVQVEDQSGPIEVSKPTQ